MICAIVIGVQTCALPILAPGEMTVVFGDSGIGKSCLVDVLSGMMAPAGFEADISGQEIDFDEYRALVGKSAYVSQQVRPWHASVRDCLCWAVPDASESMMWRALADEIGRATCRERVCKYV